MENLKGKIFGLAATAAVTFTAFASAPLATKQSFHTENAVNAGSLTVKESATKMKLNIPVSKSKTAGQNAFMSVGKHRSDFKPASRRGAAMRTATGFDLQGFVVYSDNWTSSNHFGVYSLPLTATADFTLVKEGPVGQYGLFYTPERSYLITQENILGLITLNMVEVYDSQTWDLIDTALIEDYQFALQGGVDPTSGTAYGYFYSPVTESAVCFSKINLETFEPTLIKDNTTYFGGFAINAQGEGYGITNDGKLYKIDLANGNETLVGNTGITNKYLTGATIDASTGKMYFTVSTDSEGCLYEINTADATATLLSSFGGAEEVCGLFEPQPLAQPNAPASPSALSLAFEGTSLTGNVSFTAPSSLFNGETTSGNITYTVLADGVVAATGQTQYGAAVTAEVTVPEAGTYSFVAYVSNEAGKSPSVRATKYLGQDQPLPPAKVEIVSYEDGKFLVKWDAVTKGVNGADVEGVSYTVVRMPGEVVVAENTTALQVEDAVETPSGMVGYTYIVTAKSGNAVSEPTTSNSWVLGEALCPPYEATFDDEFSLSLFTIIDGNGDGKVWHTTADGAISMAYNSSMDMDDWAILPGLKLEKGKFYQFSIDARCQGASFPERFEVKGGLAVTSEAMTDVLIEPTLVDNATFKTYKATVIPEADGVYYIGLHGISDKDMYYLYVDNIKLSAPMSANMPAAVADLTVTPDKDGGKTAVVTFTMPSLTYGGNTLASIDKAEISVDGETVSTLTDVTPGQSVTKELTFDENGVHTVSVTSSNAEGTSEIAATEVFIGIPVPAAVATPSAYEHTDNYGYVTVSWEPVTTDQDGRPLDSSNVRYNIVLPSGYVWKTITDTSFNVRACYATDKQFLTQYGVQAVTDGGESQVVQSQFVFVGASEKDYHDSFAPNEWGNLNYDYLLSAEGNGSFNLFDDTQLNVTSKDGDNAFLGFSGKYNNDKGTLQTGKIAVPSENPVLVFHTMPIAADDANTLKATVIDLEGNRTVVYDKAQSEVYNDGKWKRLSADLTAFAGKDVYIEFETTVHKYSLILLDDLKVAANVDHSVAATSIAAPAKTFGGESFDIYVGVDNLGALAAHDVTVNLYKNGDLVQSKTIESIETSDKATVAFPVVIPVTGDKENVFHAEIAMTGDEDNSDNKTNSVTVELLQRNYPKVTDLTFTETPQGIELSWKAPDLTGPSYEEVTEDFESGDSFAKSFDGWTFVDGDEKPVGGFQNLELPGLTPGTSLASFFVFDSSSSSFNASFDAHSGNKYLACLFRYDDGQLDDWAISPELPGIEQTVSFWAKSYNSTYAEKIEVYYSETDADVANFKLIREAETLPKEWKQISVTLPEGAKYFAIRSMATGSFMLLIDDVTYTRVAANSNIELQGYNVYRNGDAINESVVSQTSYLDAHSLSGVQTYQVSAVYDKGESAPEAIEVLSVSVKQLATGNHVVKTGKGYISVEGADGQAVTIYSADGKSITATTDGSNTRASVAPGAYIVKVGNKAVKVAVR